jgi:hypothetical protein
LRIVGQATNNNEEKPAHEVSAEIIKETKKEDEKK